MPKLYTMPSTDTAAVTAGKAAQTSADTKNKAYRDAAQAAIAARKKANANTGKTAYDVAYRGELNKTYRDNTRKANALNASRRPASGYAPPASPPATNSYQGTGNSTVSGGGSSAGRVPTPPRAPSKPSYTRDMKNAAATKTNTLLKRANAVYGDTRPGADNGEMIQGGASDPKNVTLSGKEFADFKAKFSASHKSSKNLSDRSLRVMARYLKSRGKGSQFGLPGAPAATPPAEG